MKCSENVKEALDELITELVEKALEEKREGDEEYKKNYQEMTDKINKFSEEYLSREEQKEFEDIISLMYSNAGDEAEYLYIQGIKDGIALLKKIGVIR